LYRAIDSTGATIDFLLSALRDADAAKCLFRKAPKSGTICIFVRHGGMGFRGGSNDAEPWDLLVRDARISSRAFR
jgi:hypothetical protein